ncbi:MAG: phosphate ABC transporter substrate-binding protein [Planctomycetota bacterium]
MAVLGIGLLGLAGVVPTGRAAEQKTVTVKGSDTMVNLASFWAEAFMKKAPGIDVTVTGGGSGTGIAALLNGTTDICNASRKIQEKELDEAAKRGIAPREHVAALDGIAVVVNPANPVSELTLEQLKKIYIGTYPRWSAVGGPDWAIVLLSRETSSGTYAFFQEEVLGRMDYAPSALLMPATSAIVQAVAEDKGAIGYVGLGYPEEAKGKVKVLKVKKDKDAPAVAPTVGTVPSGEYPIARALYLYTNGEPKGSIRAYIDFCRSAEGQKIVEALGFVPLPAKEEASPKTEP